MKIVPLNEVRANLPTMIDQSQQEAIMVTRHGKEAAVIISPSVYEAMLEAWEDAQDLKLIEESQGDWGAMHKWEDVKRELGLL
jgi:prevent-host-death family protein